MRRAVCSLLLALLAPLSAGAQPPNRAQAISNAITELDVNHAKQLLDELDSDSPTISFERARLAIYMGDCDTARAILATPTFATSPEGASLGELAKSCAQATAAAAVHEDQARGIWIRLQEERDGALVPLIVEVADRARRAIEKDLGTELPRPLRIDLVRDLFSLSAVSGLPVAAAETTGTVAVARWGRVTMITPRATPLGYPWEDTLAHEIAHLALSRATRDNAPLWLQEGLAKREETRWRPRRPFDDALHHDRVARAALASGRAVGVDKLGPSIAMLPTPEAASTAFAEVTSFVSYWLKENGEPALRLLLADLRNTGGDSSDAAMISVTGYPLAYWLERWKQELSSAPAPAEPREPPPAKRSKPADPNELARRVRLGDLLFSRGHSAAALEQLDGTVRLVPTEPALRWREARARLATGDEAGATSALGSTSDLGTEHGGWFALSGRLERARGAHSEAERSFRLAIGLDPLAEDVACEGHWRQRSPSGELPKTAPTPENSVRRALCAAARDVPRE